MKKIQTLLAVLFLLIIPNLQAQPTDCVSDRYQVPVFNNIQRTNDITYGAAPTYSGNTQSLELDFYEPAPADEYLAKRPLVVMFFGGSFLGGDKQYADMVAWCDSLSRYGYVCASVEYRLDNFFNFLSAGQAERAAYRAIQDGRAAIRYLLEDPNGLGFNIDPEHIYVGGNSAGAITAVHIAYADDSERPAATYTAPDMGCGDCSGNNYVQPFSIAGVIDLWGAILDPQMIDAADNVPMVVVHSDDDTTVPYDTGPPFGIGFFPTVYGAIPMVAEMTAKNICHQFYPYQGVGHSFYLSGNSMNSFWPAVFNHGRTFLYDKTLVFDSPVPTGAMTACVGDTETYSVPANPDSYFCWNVVNGTVISTNNEQVTVQWNTAGTGQLELTEASCLDVIGTAQTIDVNVTACSCANVDLTILHDGFPGQNSWDIVDANGVVVALGGPYSSGLSYTTNIETACLPDGCYTLNFYDSLNNGMCPFSSVATSAGTFITPGTLITPGSIVATLGTVVSPGLCGNYTLSDALGGTLASGGGAFGGTQISTFCLSGGVATLWQDDDESISMKSHTQATTLTVYPNPANEQITIEHNIFSEKNIQISIVDMNGRMIQQYSTEDSTDQAISLNVSDLMSGVYFVRIIADDTIFTEKFIKK